MRYKISSYFMAINIKWFLTISVLFGFVQVALAEDLTIAGTGDSQELLRILAKDFEANHPGNMIHIPDTTGSVGGIKSLREGTVRLARTARPLKETEQPGLIEFLFARAPIVFSVNPNLEQVKNITTAQILGIYSGKYSNWKQLGQQDHKIYVVDREAGDSSRIVLEREMAGFKSLTSVGFIAFNTQQAVSYVEDHKFTIGFLPNPSIVTRNIFTIAIDGVTPDAENINSKKYKYIVPLFLVSKGQPEGLAKQFLDYIYSPDARKIMEANGVVPADR